MNTELKTTGYGVIEIKNGQQVQQLDRYLEKNPRPGKPTHVIPVTIHALINDSHVNNGDYVGKEYGLEILSAEIDPFVPKGKF